MTPKKTRRSEVRAQAKPPTPKLPPKPKQSETAIVAAILAALAWKYKPDVLKVWRNNTAAFKIDKRFIRCGVVGSADILGVLKGGRFVCIEVKRPGGKPTPHQVAWLTEMKSLGALVGVVTSMDEAIALIEGGLGG